MKIYRENELVEIPTFATEGSACFDLRACLEVGKGIIAYNPHNRKMELPVKAAADKKQILKKAVLPKKDTDLAFHLFI
jgi:dUTPase